jgi:hypothetical protein
MRARRCVATASAQMNGWFRLSLFVILVMSLPVHGLASVARDLRGPAHYHLAPAGTEAAGSGHSHAEPAHHHHDADESVIEVFDHAGLDEPDAEEAGRLRGTGFTGDALVRATALIPPAGAGPQASGVPAAKPAPGFIGRPERPPKCGAR